MRNAIIATCVFAAWIPLAASGQNPDSEKLSELKLLSDSVLKYYERQMVEYREDSSTTFKGHPAPRFFSRPAFNRFFEEYFTLLNYQRQSLPDGNSAGLVVSENDTRLNLTLSKKMEGSILSVGAGLNIKDQSGVIFSGDKPTSGTQLSINYSYLIPKSRFYFDPDERGRNYEGRKQILDSVLTLYRIRNLQNFQVVRDKLFKSKETIAAVTDSVERYERLVGTTRNESDRAKFNQKLIGFREALVKEIDSSEKLRKEFSDLKLKKPVDETSEEIGKATTEVMIKRQLQNKAINSFWFSWVSGGVSYKREVYDTYDSVLAFSSRVGDKSFNVWSFNVSYNFFKSRSAQFLDLHNNWFSSQYLGFSYSLVAGNTFADLTATDISVQSIQTKQDSVYLFSTSKKLRDVSGIKFETYTTQRLGVQFTGTFGKSEFVGLNLNGYLEVKKAITTTNLRSGFIFKFKDTEGKKSIINFELFLLLKDLSNENEKANKGKDAWSRKEIGISTVIPFEKVFFR